MAVTDSEQVDLLTRFAADVDPLARRVLAAERLPQVCELVREMMGHCLQAPYLEHMWGAGELYAIWGELDDILDGRPVDHGPDTEAVADRELRRAAGEWLDMPRTEAGIRDYAYRWRTRLAERTWI
ncbi:hypothetical protein Cci01nite_38910 [Catellatospora citrea]|uniref:Uncharacterized protein n=1 Tax=Catellatospora citrea TaxID=53366 RepID=A0A8J3KFJ7_9ACTN|nr:hypothetical protein C8E86_7175 [Catellatospora citrea]GIF98797.1 hypothetical protein Cci01nite_38910 [Catellatospora citrea]